MARISFTCVVSTAISVSISLFSVSAAAQGAKPMDPDKQRVVDYWTKERRAKAIPRDLVIDPRGLGYLRMPDKSLVPYGHDVAAQERPRAQTPVPFARPGTGGSGDTKPPSISAMNPAEGAKIGASYTFEATVTDDASGVKSVTFKIQKTGSMVQSFSARKAPDSDVWSVGLQGFTDGTWNWSVEAKDNGDKGGNLGTSGPVTFTVATSSGGGGTGGGGSTGTVTNAAWKGGAIQIAAGRIYFEMPGNAKRKVWNGYVCSGTVATDGKSDRSVIITAAHCVYDDANKAFARNVLFIPNQADTSGSGTDLNCENDVMGCWVPSFGVVDKAWTQTTFPNNIAVDYAYYVVNNTGAHTFSPSRPYAYTSDALDEIAPGLDINVNQPTVGAYTHALGYSYSEDPKFMYCAENMTIKETVNWWLSNCGLSGGSSGGPWIQPMDESNGSGPIISVNSWGYTNSPGMAGPKLAGTSASCVFNAAKGTEFTEVSSVDGDAGVPVICP